MRSVLEAGWGVVELAEGVSAGQVRAIARAVSVVENHPGDAPRLIQQLFELTGRARLVGVTGAPGVGKSTLVNRLATEWRQAGRRVGILAVDPTSPFSGGAILGDRIRMQTHSGDDGVFVRSMASRGHLGGLAHATSDAAVILDAAGFDVVLIETVGVGQGEVEIARTADVSVVVTVPGTGDDVQTLKAGIMEIADIFVVNKSDLDGADRTASEIEAMLGLQPTEAGVWRPPVLKARAATGEGVAAIIEAVDRFHVEHRKTQERRRARAEFRLTEILRDRYIGRLETQPATREALREAIDRIAAGAVDPYTAAEQVMRCE